MSNQIQLRSDVSFNWAGVNPILAQGEPGYELDTGKIKYGDGVTRWNSLAYFAGGGAGGNYGDANVAAFLPTYSGNVGDGSGYVYGNGRFLTGIVASGNAAAAGPNGAIQFNNSGAVDGSAGLVYDGANLSLAGSFVPAANVAYDLGTPTAQWKDLWLSGNTIYLGNTSLSTNGNGGLSIGGSNVVTSSGNGEADFSSIVATGNIQADYIIANLTLQGNSLQVAGLAETGNLITNNFIANGAVTAASLLVTGPFMSLQDVFFGTIHATELLLSGPMVVNGDLTTTGNLNAQNVVVNDLSIQAMVNAVDISASGTIIGNALSTQSVSTQSLVSTGNVQGEYLIGNGAFITGLPITYSNSNVQSFLPIYSGNLSASYLTVRDERPTSFFIEATPTHVSLGKDVETTITIDDNGIQMVGNVSSVGNITTDNYFIGNGAFLTGISGGNGSSYSNADVIALLESNTVSDINITGNISSQYFVGNGALLTGITAGTDYSNANVQAFLPTYGGDISADTLSASAVSATGNVEGQYFVGNGAFLTGISVGTDYSNANVESYLPTYTGALAGSTAYVGGNNPGDYFLDIAADHASLGMFAGQTISVGGSGIQIAGTGGVHIMGVVGATVTIGGGTSGDIHIANNVSASGSITADSLSAGVIQGTDIGATNITSADTIGALGQISAMGNVVTDSYFVGNGAFLTGIATGSDYSNANVEAFLASGTMTSDISTAGNIVGNDLSATGNIYIGNTVFTRTLTVGRASSPVTVPLSSNNTLNVLTASGNVAVYTT